MLTKTEHWFPIEHIQQQVAVLPEFDRVLHINETDGDLLSGEYKVKAEFVGTPLGDVLHQLGDVGEARLLKLKNEGVYTAHCDPDDRWHLTITTSPYSFLVDIDQQTLHHLPADGAVWYMDTGVVHSAINLGGGERIHLNVRKRLPSYKAGGWRITFTGEYDWKQRLYVSVLGYVNRAIKLGHVTGIQKTADNEMLLNVIDEKIINVIAQLGESAGLNVVLLKDE